MSRVGCMFDVAAFSGVESYGHLQQLQPLCDLKGTKVTKGALVLDLGPRPSKDLATVHNVPQRDRPSCSPPLCQAPDQLGRI